MDAMSIIATRWELAFTLLDKLGANPHGGSGTAGN